jgi:hypothetical protein
MPDARPTQDFVPVQEVRNGVIVMKNGGLRGALMCSSVNFALKGEDEQKAIIGGFQTFLNTLDFTVQIVIHSRKIDIRPYLETLEERVEKQSSDLMKIQVREYIQFVKTFIEGSDIMTKVFYVVVPFDPAIVNTASKAVPFFSKTSQAQTDTSFEEHKVQLEQRMALVENGLQSSGVRSARLSTEEIIELLYKSFNTGELETPIKMTPS